MLLDIVAGNACLSPSKSAICSELLFCCALFTKLNLLVCWRRYLKSLFNTTLHFLVLTIFFCIFFIEYTFIHVYYIAARRKPGPKPRRVTPSPLPPPGPSPSPSLAQLFAAADSPRPSSGSEENESGTHHKVSIVC